MFAWEAGRKGLEVHALAEPTKLEALKKEYVQKKDALKDKAKNSILEKYGGDEHLNNAPPRELIFAQSERYVEYSRTGEVVKGEEASMTKTRYEEDVHPGNHTSVWGSFWHEGKWGFKCCYSFEKRSYCTGASGRDLFESSPSNAASAFERKSDSNIEKDNSDKDDKLEKKKHKKKKKKKDKKKHEEDDFETKVAKAMEKQRREEECANDTKDERKRAYNSLSGGHDKELTEAEIEAYKRRRVREDDPMAGFL